MDDYRNAAKSVLGGPAMATASGGELLTINERLSYIQKRCGELANSLSSTNERVFGATPQDEEGCYAERGDGAAAALHITIDRIEVILSAAEREAQRISRL